jgi:hypothetical protein
MAQLKAWPCWPFRRPPIFFDRRTLDDGTHNLFETPTFVERFVAFTENCAAGP